MHWKMGWMSYWILDILYLFFWHFSWPEWVFGAISIIRIYNLFYVSTLPFCVTIQKLPCPSDPPLGTTYFSFEETIKLTLMKSKQMPLNRVRRSLACSALTVSFIVLSFISLPLKSPTDVWTARTFVESFQSLLSCRLFFEHSLLTKSWPTIIRRWQQSQRYHASILTSAKVWP